MLRWGSADAIINPDAFDLAIFSPDAYGSPPLSQILIRAAGLRSGERLSRDHALIGRLFELLFRGDPERRL
jgi:hypothetical protein